MEIKKSAGKSKKYKNVNTNISLRTKYLENIQIFCDNNHISRGDFFDELNTLLIKPGMSFAVLNDRYDNSQMVKKIADNHLDTISTLKRFEESFLKKIETNHANNFDFANENTNKILELKTKENLQIEEIYEYLKQYIISDKGAGKDEALKIFEKVKQTIEKAKEVDEAKKIAENEKTKSMVDSKSIVIEGHIYNKPFSSSTKDNTLYYIISIAEKMVNSSYKVWGNVLFMEGAYTQKLNLTSKEDIVSYFSNMKNKDFLKLRCQPVDKSFISEDGTTSMRKTYQVQEVLSHIPKASVKQ
jgi:hypothetical protein